MHLLNGYFSMSIDTVCNTLMKGFAWTLVFPFHSVLSSGDFTYIFNYRAVLNWKIYSELTDQCLPRYWRTQFSFSGHNNLFVNVGLPISEMLIEKDQYKIFIFIYCDTITSSCNFTVINLEEVEDSFSKFLCYKLIKHDFWVIQMILEIFPHLKFWNYSQQYSFEPFSLVKRYNVETEVLNLAT